VNVPGKVTGTRVDAISSFRRRTVGVRDEVHGRLIISISSKVEAEIISPIVRLFVGSVTGKSILIKTRNRLEIVKCMRDY